MIEELLKLLFTNFRPLDLVTLVAIIAGFIWQVRRDRFKPQIDKVDATGRLATTAIGLMDSAVNQKTKSDTRADKLEKENVELEARVDALASLMVKEKAEFAIELATQKAEIILLKSRVTELETTLTARDTALSESTRIIAGLREQMAGFK